MMSRDSLCSVDTPPLRPRNAIEMVSTGIPTLGDDSESDDGALSPTNTIDTICQTDTIDTLSPDGVDTKTVNSDQQRADDKEKSLIKHVPPPFFWEADTYRTYRARFVQLGIYVALTIGNQLYWISFAPITSFAMNYFNVNASLINLLALTFSLMALPGTLFFSFVMHSYGIRVSLLVSSAVWTSFL